MHLRGGDKQVVAMSIDLRARNIQKLRTRNIQLRNK